MTRTGALDHQEILSMEFVTASRAKGMNDRQILFHVLKNAAPVCLAVMGLQAGNLIGGSILIETVFAWPGTGFLLNSAIFRRDLADPAGHDPGAGLLLHDAQSHRRRDPDPGGSAHQARLTMAIQSPSIDMTPASPCRWSARRAGLLAAGRPPPCGAIR
jgi:hypothetical protein